MRPFSVDTSLRILGGDCLDKTLGRQSRLSLLHRSKTSQIEVEKVAHGQLIFPADIFLTRLPRTVIPAERRNEQAGWQTGPPDVQWQHQIR